MHVIFCTLRLRLSAEPAPEEQHSVAPAITVTEDNSIPVDDDDFVEYYGLQAYIEGRLSPPSSSPVLIQSTWPINKMVLDGEPSIGMPRPANVSATVTFERTTLKT